MHAIIIDDEIRGAQGLQKMLQHFHPGIEVLALAHSGTQGLEAIARHQPQLVFLDIQMPDMSGFDMLEKLPAPGFQLIFTTAHDEYAIRAFRYAAVDYLLKPIDIDELDAALQKARQRGAPQPAAWQALLQQLKTSQVTRLSLPGSDGIVIVNIADIIWLQSSGSYTTFYLRGQPPVLVSKNIGEYEDLLHPHQFIRIHNSSMVNMRFVQRYIRGDGGTVVMSGGIELEVSRRKKDAFLEMLEQVAPGK